MYAGDFGARCWSQFLDLGAGGEEVGEGGVCVKAVLGVGEGFERRVFLGVVPDWEVIGELYGQIRYSGMSMGSGTYAGGGGSSFFVDGASDLGLCFDGIGLDWHDNVGLGSFSNGGGHYVLMLNLHSSRRVSDSGHECQLGVKA